MDSDTKDSSTRKPIPNNLLRHQREKRGWSQRKVAELLGTDEAKVSRWEKGGRNPSPYYREKFIALYGASAAELGFIDQEGTAILHPRREDWGEAPHTGPFYGRNRELVEGKQWILDDHCRVAAILGMGGIGKTSLAVMLVDNIKEEFDYIYWCSLQNAPPLQNILHDCIKFVSDQQRTDLPEAVDSQISLLVKYLQERRCLLVLDNFETLLQAGKDTGSYREGYEGYGRLLQRIGEVKHQSCLLLTSREKPKEIALLEGNLSTVHSSQLRGVGLRDGQAILRDKRVYGTEETWEKLIQHYAGNPLALKLVCQFIWEVFDGDIATFLKEGEKLLSDIRDILDQQFERLSALEQELIYWLAIERESVSLKDIQENIVHPLSTRALQEALRSLRRRDLIEARKSSFNLQNVVMEYVTDRFVDQVCE